jgi:hypothetical protein
MPKPRPVKPDNLIFGWFQDQAITRAGEVEGAMGVAVYAALCFWQMRQMRKPCFYASYANIASIARVSTRTAIRVVKKLRQARLIEVVELGSNHLGKPNKYQLNLVTVSHRGMSDSHKTCDSEVCSQSHSNINNLFPLSAGKKIIQESAPACADAPLEAGAARRASLQERAAAAGMSLKDWLLMKGAE